MKIAKKLIALLAVIAITIGPFASTYDVNAATQQAGYNITVSNVAVSPTQINVGALASLKFDFNIEAQPGHSIKAGDTISLSTNIGTMFGNLPISDVALFSDSGKKIATVTITGNEIKVKVASDFDSESNFLNGSLYTGARLKALQNGAAAGAPVTKALKIEDSTTNVTFNVPQVTPGTGGGSPSDPDMRTINNRMMEKQGWAEGYDTAKIKLIANQLGSLRLFNTYNNIDNHFGTYQEQTNMMVVDKIPGNGVVDLSTVKFTAVRYNWMKIPAGGNRHYAQAAPGSIMPIERGSQWMPVTQYFNQITQSSSDTYDSFYAKIKAQKLSYGIYRDPATGGDTFIANMSNDTLKYTDLEPYLAGVEKIKDIYGENGPSHGNVVTFFVEFDTHYPSISGVERLTNKGDVKSDQANDSASVAYTIDKAAGSANVASGTVLVKAVDGADNTTPIAGAEFKIQVESSGKWKDYYIRGRKATAKTNASGEASISTLSKGKYRLVQTDAPNDYQYNNNEFKPNPAHATAGKLNATSGEFTIVSATAPGFSTIVPNYQKITISGEKTWDDANNQDGKRPNQIKVNLMNGATKVATTTVQPDAAGKWEYKFTNVNKYENGQVVNYTVEEEPVDGYTATVTGYNIKNSYTPKKTSVTVTKKWDDNNDQDGKRPEKVKVQLYGDGVKVGGEVELEKATWSHTWNNLPEKKAGQNIKYTVKEVGTVDGYTATYDTQGENKVVITNKHVPETIKVEGEKTWYDANDQDGKRPNEITVNVLANGREVRELKVTAADNWKYSFDNLPKYENGQEIQYTVTEDAVSEYNTDIQGYNIKNSYTPKKTSATVTKRWDDGNDKDKIRPNVIRVQLYANGEKKGAEVELNAADKWTYTWKDLPQRANGKDIKYTVKEVGNISGYKVNVDDKDHGNMIITNSHTPKVVKSPKTGDDNGLLPYAITLLLSGATFAGMFISRRRMAN